MIYGGQQELVLRLLAAVLGRAVQRDRRLRGAATGASVWLVEGIGIACGLGFYVAAAMATGIGLFVLVGLGLVERWTRRRFGGD
jgi:putative Mg2+ transporter-C (MgtC) family protein